MSKTMHDMNAVELEQLIAKLKDYIARNPRYSSGEKVELEDAEQLFRERRKQPVPDDGEIIV